MKTKHLVAMALPLAFTACSQEELINENNQATTSERKVVENVVFKFNAEADSRMHFDEEYKWDAGDKFGACLMDQFGTAMIGDFTWEKWFAQFELVDYLHTNYPFTRDENGSWTNAEAVMQEGNYFFYYPYNNNLGGQRTPIQLNVPTDQIVKDGQKTSSVLD
ncbi:MAG: fimbrillin family protein, partial [Phocaeicola sp.]|nr:fimbrillin family protein [Phocaeicola sp.]